ncbi:hypothetical protein ACUHMQ_05690 [Chitinimonas sp. PSY-7]|uniref:hypothetical protein n=1 Tax=Chitinimonas sp. PSY-7 TaxID=3459088 RepID=UPI0040402B5A
MKLSPRSISPVLAALFYTALAQATPSNALDHLNISVGAFHPTDADVSLDVTSHAQTLSTGKLDLGKQKSLPRAHVDLLLGDSQGLAFDYYRLKRTTQLNESQTFRLGGQTYDMNVSLHPEFKLDIANAAYRWWLGNGDTVGGLGLGVAYYNLRVNVDASASANGQTVSGNESYKDDAYAPLVALGVRHAFSKDFRVYADGTGIYKRGGKARGHIYNAALGMEWYPMKRVGVGAEYGFTKVKVQRDTQNYRADLNVHLEGPSAFLRMRF